jgi:hypothetical protein
MPGLRKVPQVMFLGGTTRKRRLRKNIPICNHSGTQIFRGKKKKNRLGQMNKEGLRCRQKTQGSSQPI